MSAITEVPPDQRPVSRRRTRIRRATAASEDSSPRTTFKRSNTSVKNSATRLTGIDIVRKSLERVAGPEAKEQKRRATPGDFPDDKDVPGDDLPRHTSSEWLAHEPYGQERRSYSRGEYLVEADPTAPPAPPAPPEKPHGRGSESPPEGKSSGFSTAEEGSASSLLPPPPLPSPPPPPRTEDREAQTEPVAWRRRASGRPHSTPPLPQEAARKQDAERLRRSLGEAANRYGRAGAGAPYSQQHAARAGDRPFSRHGTRPAEEDRKPRWSRPRTTATALGPDGKAVLARAEDLAGAGAHDAGADAGGAPLYDDFGNRISGDAGPSRRASAPGIAPALATARAPAPAPALDPASAPADAAPPALASSPERRAGRKGEGCTCDCPEGTCDDVCREPPCAKPGDNEPTCLLSTWVHQCCRFLLRLLCFTPSRPRQ